jgi:photosynthetic reaction center cytochrome c subunit
MLLWDIFLKERHNMKLYWNRLMLAVAVGTAVWLIGAALARPAAAQGPAPAPKPPTAGETFKAVTTSTLKGLTVSDFLGSMGVMAAALGYDCADCHIAAGTDKVNWEFDTPRKKTARKMVEMVAVINRTNFGGAQMVTCWTCHHGRFMPSTTIGLDALYGTPNDERNDIVVAAAGQPSATQILDKYIQAVGGAQRLAGLTSFIATGKSEGYGGLGGDGTFQIFAKAPNQRTTLITFKDHPERGDNTRAFNGSAAWVKSPRGLFPEYQMTGGDLDGAKFDAQLSFPGQIKQILTNWRVGANDSIGDRDVQVVQGGGPRGFLATLYFDTKSGLLVRVVRYTPSPIGRVPTQLDYDDYRDVGGIKFPFKYTFSWLDGKDSFQLSDVKTNVPIDAARFGKP